jgi:hypothetical protein
MSTLEDRYRRLLAVYPAGHRRTYGEEMLGVLMQGARPGQRRPAPGEAADLLWSGLAARAGRGVRGLRGHGGRDAAAVAGLIGAVVLAAVALRRLGVALIAWQRYDIPFRAFGLDGGQLLDVAARGAVWLAVVTAVLLGARRTAVALGGAGLLVEVAAIAAWTPRDDFRPITMSWAPVLATLVVLLLATARRGRSAPAVLGRPGTALVAGGIALAAVSRSVLNTLGDVQVAGLITAPDALGVVAAALVAGGLWRVPRGVRGRVLVLLAPLVAVPVAQSMTERVAGLTYAPVVTPGIVLTAVVLMLGLPVLALLAATAALWAADNLTVTARPDADQG